MEKKTTKATKETMGSGKMDDLFIDLCTIKLGGIHLDNNDLDKIINELGKKKPNLSRIKLKNNYKLTEEDISLILKSVGNER